MNVTRSTKLAALSLTLTLVASSPATAQSGLSGNARPERAGSSAPIFVKNTTSAGSGSECNLIDFEGLPHFAQIGTVFGDIDVTFGPSWLALIDLEAGGTGNFANEPSPDTVCFFLESLDPIDFSQPVQFIQIFYVASAASVPVTLTAWDGPGGTGSIVDQASGSTIGTSFDGADCTGDPEGEFCLFDTISLTSLTNSILSITISGATADQFAFDNMTFCTGDPIVAYCYGTGCPCGNDDPGAGCANSNGSGALLSASGTPSVVADDLVLSVTNARANNFSIFYMGPSEACTAFGDGLRAVAPAPGNVGFLRYPVQQADATGFFSMGPGIVQYSLANFPVEGQITAGATWHFQGFYRDPFGPCSTHFNVSNGMAVTFNL